MDSRTKQRFFDSHGGISCEGYKTVEEEWQASGPSQLERIERKLDVLIAAVAQAEPLLKHLPRWLKVGKG
jgi:hypothetical protein